MKAISEASAINDATQILEAVLDQIPLKKPDSIRIYQALEYLKKKALEPKDQKGEELG